MKEVIVSLLYHTYAVIIHFNSTRKVLFSLYPVGDSIVPQGILYSVHFRKKLHDS